MDSHSSYGGPGGIRTHDFGLSPRSVRQLRRPTSWSWLDYGPFKNPVTFGRSYYSLGFFEPRRGLTYVAREAHKPGCHLYLGPSLTELAARGLYDRQSTLTVSIRKILLGLPDVTVGRRFGGEAFFFRKRFFCHFHPSKNVTFLETFVWNRVGEVVKGIPGVIPHPEYGGYGWVRLPLSSEEDVDKGGKLVGTTYRYLRTIKRISLRKDRFVPSSIESVKSKLPQVNFRVKEANKTMQIIMETPNAADFESADNILDRAAKMLKRI